MPDSDADCKGRGQTTLAGVRCTPIGMQGFRFGAKGSNGTAVRWNVIRPTLGEEPVRWRSRRCKGGIIALAIALSSAMVLAGEPNLGSELGFAAPPQNEGGISGFEWRDAPPLLLARSSPAVVVLSSGDIVVIGGMASEGPTATTEILDHATSIWRFGPTLNSRRVGHTATLLQDGTVLVVGGDTGSGATSSAEILDIGKAASTPVPRMSFARSGHSAILLKSGNVLVTGGTDWITGIWRQAEVFNVQTHSWIPAGSMSSQRLFFSMQLLPDGSALAIGGDTNQTSERYDATTNTWSQVAKMISPRFYSSSALVNGKVIAAGGITNNNLVNSSEMFDPATNSWKATGSMQMARARFSLTPLPNGDLLAAGSQGPTATSPSCEVFHPETSTWQNSPQMNVSRGAQGYAVTSDGTTFVIGGKSGGAATSSVEIFGRRSVKPPTKPCMPIDLVPLVQAAKELPGNSAHGLIAKLEAAQAQYDEGDFDTCINIMTAFYNQVRAFARNGHMEPSHAKAIYDGYVMVIEGMGGEPLPPFTYRSVAKFKDLFITRG
jgi:hypothetical protein